MAEILSIGDLARLLGVPAHVVAYAIRRHGPEPGIAIQPEQLDTDRWLLNVRNGTIDLKTGALRAHDQGDYITKLAPVEFHPEAACPAWLDRRRVGTSLADPSRRGQQRKEHPCRGRLGNARARLFRQGRGRSHHAPSWRVPPYGDFRLVRKTHRGGRRNRQRQAAGGGNGQRLDRGRSNPHKAHEGRLLGILAHPQVAVGDEDLLGEFLTECCDCAPGAKVKAADLYAAYKNHAEAAGDHPLPQRKFGGALTERGFERVKSSGMVYLGVTLKPQSWEDGR